MSDMSAYLEIQVFSQCVNKFVQFTSSESWVTYHWGRGTSPSSEFFI